MKLDKQLAPFQAFVAQCPHPEKRGYGKKKAVIKDAHRLRIQYYHCICGKWHLTSKGGLRNAAHRKRLG